MSASGATEHRLKVHFFTVTAPGIPLVPLGHVVEYLTKMEDAEGTLEEARDALLVVMATTSQAGG